MRRLAVLTLFASLTVVYFRDVIWAPAGTLLTKHLATDLHGHFVHVWERLQMLGQGFIPIGDYWVMRGGGFPAVSNDQLLIPQELALMGVYAATDDFTLALRIIVPLFYFATLVTAYWYGQVLFKRRDVGILIAVAYAFSMYGTNQLEHLELIGVQPLILLALIFLEKTLQAPRLRYILLTSLFLFTVAVSNLYALYFTLMFVAFRIVYQLLTNRVQWRSILTLSTKLAVIFVLLTLPFMLPQLTSSPNLAEQADLGQELLHYSQPPNLYFYRAAEFEPHITEIYFMYLGIPLIALACVPMLSRHRPRPMYLFFLLALTFFMLYSIGQYGPLNIATLFHKYAPMAYFIRVPGRALLLGYLCLAVCAGFGFTYLTDRWPILKRTPLVLLLVALVFADLTVGFEPTTLQIPEPPRNAYQYIREQPDDFRVIEISSVHDQQALTIILTERDTINTILWAFGHFEPLRTFSGLYEDYLDTNVSADGAALYGVKYIVVNTDPRYSEAYRDALRAIGGPTHQQVVRVQAWLEASNDYSLVFVDGNTNVYENLQYKGLVHFNHIEADYQTLTWTRKDPNTLIMQYYSSVSASIIVSQSFANGWVATLDGTEALTVSDYNSVQQIDVPAGSHTVILYYRNHSRWLIIFAAFYATLVALVGWLFYRERRA